MMEQMIEKIGLYDVAGSFCIGVVFLSLSYFIGMQTPLAQLAELFELINNDIINVMIFCMISYFIGLLFHELTSIIEKKREWFDYRKNDCETFLIDDLVIHEENERNEHLKLARAVLRKKQNDIFKQTDCRQYFQKCKIYAEQHGRSNLIERIDAIYTFCHTLSIALIFILLELLVIILVELIKLIPILSFECNTVIFRGWLFLSLIMFFIIATIFLLDHKARRFSPYRIRIIVRYYYEKNYQFTHKCDIQL